VVRGPAAVLVLVAVAWVYFLVPELLPAIRPADTSQVVAGSIATILVIAVATGVAGLADAAFVVPLVLLGAALIAGTMDAAGVGAAATIPETVVYACIGVGFGVLFDAPALVLAVPVFVAGIEIISALGGGAHPRALGGSPGGDPLSLELPDWHNGLSAARFGLADIVFTGIYATYARRFGLRFAAAGAGMAIGLAASVVLSISLNTAIPELPFLGAGLLLPNIDRVVALFRATAEG
jgi:hypothetical protein